MTNEPPKRWHSASTSTVVTWLSSASDGGLTPTEVSARLAKFGRNTLPEAPPESLLKQFAAQFKSPLIWLLLVAAAIAFVLKERTDAVVIVVVLVVNAVVGTYQERRAARSMAALKKLSLVRARVVREGTESTIEAADLVPGDVVLLAAGDAVPADARVLECAQLACAEAVLTGESLPVEKRAQEVADDAIIAEQASLVFSGTLVTAGRARVMVVGTGFDTQLGRIAKLTQADDAPTPLEHRLAQFGRLLVGLAILMFVVVLVAGYLRGLPMAEVLLVGISQIVSVVPEGLPVALTVALAVGTRRMAAHRAIVRHLGAVETLGCTTVICTDKTGTLTRNEMTVVKLWLPSQRTLTVTGTGYGSAGELLENGASAQVDPAVRALVEAGLACNDSKLSQTNGSLVALGDPTEAALLVLGQKAKVTFTQPRTAELPFDSGLRLMATGHGELTFIKGAPEAVLRLCRLSATARAEVDAATEAMSREALRVLAFARLERPLDATKGFEGMTEQATLLGLCGEIDPPRDGVREAVAACHRAGIRVVMVTGDHQATGLAIAKQLGIAAEHDEAIEGGAFEALKGSLAGPALAEKLAHVVVFARVQPEQKLHIVEALQRAGHVVAMTGDGVNDAPALVRADVGVGMGLGGTDVAREASAVVVMDDDFGTIVKAVEEGRLVYQNIKKATVLLLSSGVAEMVILVGSIIAGFPMPFAAVQILWNNIVTEGTITLNLVMDPKEGDELTRPPVPRAEAIVPLAALARLLFLGTTMSVLVLGFYWWRRAAGLPFEEVQTETFTLLAVCEWFNVLNCRSEHRSAFTWRLTSNWYLVGGLIASNLLQAAVVYLPFLNGVFHTRPLAWQQVLLIGAVGSVVLWVEELRKLVLRRRS
jgi:Ca2+-transporting ATPase